MKILYATDDRHDALLAAGALRAVAPAASLTWAGRLPDAAEWLSSHREIDVIVVNAEVGNQCSAPFVRHARSLGLTAPILVVVPQARSLPAELIEAGPDEFVVKNQSLLPRLTTIVSRAIQREQAKRRLVEMAAENRRLREGEARAQRLDNRLTAALTLLQQRDADVESALGRLRTRETELVEAVQAQRVLEQRRAALQASLHDLELRSSDDRIAATRQAAEHQSAYEAALAARVAECDALDQELVVARETLSRAEKRHASELSDAAARFGERLEQELRRALDLHAGQMASAEAAFAEQRAKFEDQLERASAAHAAIEGSVVDLQRQLEASRTTAAIQLTSQQQERLRQQQEYEARLAEAAATNAIAGQRLFELEADLVHSRNERASEAAAASARASQLEAAHREAEDRRCSELEAAAAAHAALEQSIASIQEQHASVMEASAAHLAHQQREHEARLAEAAEARTVASQRLFELEADLDRSRQERNAEAAANAALEQSIASLQLQHASAIETSAVQLAHQQREYETQLAEAAAAGMVASQRLLELEAGLEHSRTERAAETAASSTRVAQLEADLTARESAHRDAEDRHRSELNAAATVHAALEQSIASLHEQHASSMEATAAQLAAQQREHESRLADQTAAREAVEYELRETVATRERLQREYDSHAAAAAERLAEREAELAASLAARLAVEQRLVDTERALSSARESAVAERAEAINQAATRQAAFEAQLAREAEARAAIERELAETRIASVERLQKLSGLLDKVRVDAARAIERLTAGHATERARLEAVLGERETELKDQAARHASSQLAAQESFATLEGELRAALAAQSQQVDELKGERQTLTQELTATRNQRDALQLEAHRAPELAKQLAAIRTQSRRQFEQSPVSTLRCSPDGALRDANHALVAALGYRSVDELRAAGFPASVFETADDFGALIQRSQNGPRQSADFVLTKKDGGRLSMRLHVSYVSADRIEIVAEDLTSLRAAEERLIRAHRLEAVGRVAAETADTCDTLLRNVSRSGHELLASLGGDTPQRHEGEALFADVTRAAGFLRQLSAYGHKQARASLPVDVIQVLRDLEHVLRNVAGDDIELVLPRKGSALNVDVDVERVERILVNVAAYGRARMPSGGRLIVELARVAVDRRFTTKYPNVREGGHALIRISEVRAPSAVWSIGLRDARPSVSGAVVERPGVDLGALQALIGDCGGHLWMNAEPGGNMEVKIRLPLRAPAPNAHVARSAGRRAMVRWFQS